MKDKNIFPLVISVIAYMLISMMCKKSSEFSSLQDRSGYQASIIERSEADFTTMVIDMDAGNGNCYRITLNRQIDNSVTYSKIQISCTESCIKTNVFASTLVVPSEGKISISNNTCWYIPLLDGEVVSRNSGYYQCFCEGTCIDPEYTASCVFNTNEGRSRCATTCCTDCDMEYCDDPGLPHRDEQGIYVLASYITIN